MNIWWSVRYNMLVIGLWCFAWSEPRMHLCSWWWMMDRDHKAWNVLSLCGLIMDILDLNYWRIFYCINVMIWVWLMSGIATKFWVNIFRCVRGFALVKARIHAGSDHHSHVYYLKYDIWSCRLDLVVVAKFCVLLCVLVTMFWWQCSECSNWLTVIFFSDDGFSVIDWFSCGWFRDWWLIFQWLVDANVFDDWITVMMDPVWKFMKRGPWRKKEGHSLL